MDAHKSGTLGALPNSKASAEAGLSLPTPFHAKSNEHSLGQSWSLQGFYICLSLMYAGGQSTSLPSF